MPLTPPGPTPIYQTHSIEFHGKNVDARIELDPEWLSAFCGRWHVRQLSLFGSVIRADFDDASDVDVLVEFEEAKSPGFFGIAQMERELSTAMDGREVDIRTPGDLSPYFRDDVIRTARVQYAAS